MLIDVVRMYLFPPIGAILIQLTLHELFHELRFHHFYALPWSFLLLWALFIDTSQFMSYGVGIFISLISFFTQGILRFILSIFWCLNMRYLIWVGQHYKISCIFKALQQFILNCAICFLFLQEYFVWRDGYFLNLIFNVLVVKWNVHFPIFFDRCVVRHYQHFARGPGITGEWNDIVLHNIYWAGFHLIIHYSLGLE